MKWLSALIRRWSRGRDLGRRGEAAAAAHLRRQGLSILGRNIREGRGEIDIVALDGPALVFVEVKSRTSTAGQDREVTGLERIDARKRRRLRRACDRYRKRAGPTVEHYRLDAITVEFEGEGRRRRVREVRWYPAIADLDDP